MVKNAFYRPKQHPKQPASNYNDDQYRQPDQSQQQGHIVQFPSTFLQQIEEETKSGKMLGKLRKCNQSNFIQIIKH